MACWCFGGMFMLLSIYLGLSISKPDVYIVYLGHSHMQDSDLTSESHKKLLLNVFDSEEEVESSMVYSYTYGFSGFAAKLTQTQANILADRDMITCVRDADMEEIISVSKSEVMKVHSTRSWDFMGLPLDSMANNNKPTPPHLSFGDEVIVGIFDTGIWPESKSFHEEAGIGPVPSSWKGQCVEGEMFNARACNRKLIGARYYLRGFEAKYGPLNKTVDNEYRSPRDRVGHGTHIASTAVGSIVHNASFYGFGQGTARGGAPRARLAVYKTCWNLSNDATCTDADVLAAFCDALRDGVHIISGSIGPTPPLRPWFARNPDIASFHAMQLGVTVLFSAGNYETPYPSFASNVSPWTICVAASTIDRSFPTQIVVDDNLTFVGEGFVSTKILTYLSDASAFFTDSVCDKDKRQKNKTLPPGRVILCFSHLVDIDTAVVAVKNVSGLGLIYIDPLSKQISDPYAFPIVHLDMIQGTKLWHYVRLAKNQPKIKISPSKTAIGESAAPSVAYFSARGPNSIAPDILKPDLSAPGVNILAAWPPKTPPTIISDDTRSVDWNFQSGTSMACPHVTGTAALIKAAHPNWSPAAIRSALMTTAHTRDTTYDDIQVGGWMRASDPFDIGAGHILPLKALDPGLVYDMTPNDYILFLCSMGYTQEQINMTVLPLPGTKTTCPKTHTSISNMNYPSITVSNLQYTTTIKRTVRNVGSSKNAVYFPRIISPNGVGVTVWPRVLFFSWFKDEITYYVTLRPRKRSNGRYDFGEIVWTDRYHNVRSPLVVSVNNIDGHDSDGYVSHSTIEAPLSF